VGKYRYLVFDADGTLFDYDAAEARALESTFASFQIPYDADIHGLYVAINRRVWADFEKGRISSRQLRTRRFEELVSESGWEADPAVLSREYLIHLGNAGVLLPGARDAVERLSKDFTLALATNGISDVQKRRLAASGLGSFFAAVVISDQIGIAKPASGYFDILFERLGHPPISETLIIGDGLSSDMAGGEGYGMDTCWFNPRGLANETAIRPTYEISTLEEIDAIVGYA
jgi:2-haloacid dehalogenase